MQNVKIKMQNYFAAWWEIMARPIYFYTRLKEEHWQDNPLSFLLVTSWLAAFMVTVAVFFLQYVPIGSTLVEGVTGVKFIIILPVLLTLSLVFFAITLLIVGGLLVLLLGSACFLLAWVMNYIYILLGGVGNINRMLQGTFYSSAVFLAVLFPVIFAFLTRSGVLDFSLFRVGFNLFYGFTSLYIYGLWAVAGRKAYGVSKPKAFLGALAPIMILLIFGFIFDKMALPKFESWITPLK